MWGSGGEVAGGTNRGEGLAVGRLSRDTAMGCPELLSLEKGWGHPGAVGGGGLAEGHGKSPVLGGGQCRKLPAQ